MSTRVTEAEVKDIIDTDLTEEQIRPFIEAASQLITDTLSGEEYGTITLKEIERWLSAHFIAIRDPRVAQEKIGDAAVTYQGKTGLGLDHTSYGQQVLLLEHHGVLAALQQRKRPAEVRVIT